jgi:hypothetical protein
MPTFLHVGCGPLRKAQTTRGFNTPEWTEVRLDIDPTMQPDIVAGISDMSMVADGFADALYSAHNIEHVYMFEVPAVLAEFHRVLKSDGFLVVTCPDLQAIAELVARGNLLEPAYESTGGPISALDMLYGHGPSLAKGQLYMAHKCGFTNQTLLQVLERAGFGSVGVVRRPTAFDLWAIASKCERTKAEMLALANEHFPLTV